MAKCTGLNGNIATLTVALYESRFFNDAIGHTQQKVEPYVKICMLVNGCFFYVRGEHGYCECRCLETGPVSAKFVA